MTVLLQSRLLCSLFCIKHFQIFVRLLRCLDSYSCNARSRKGAQVCGRCQQAAKALVAMVVAKHTHSAPCRLPFNQGLWVAQPSVCVYSLFSWTYCKEDNSAMVAVFNGVIKICRNDLCCKLTTSGSLLQMFQLEVTTFWRKPRRRCEWRLQRYKLHIAVTSLQCFVHAVVEVSFDEELTLLPSLWEVNCSRSLARFRPF